MTTATGKASGAPTVIRKYDNRRLYDTTQGRYVTLAEIASRLRGGERVRIVNARGGSDVTRQVLAQILCDIEQSDDGMLDAEVLARLIALAGGEHGPQVAGTIGRALDRMTATGPRHTVNPAYRAAAMLRPRGNINTRAMAARIDVLESRLRSLISSADRSARGANAARGK